MERPIDRRQTLMIVGGIAVTGGLAGCTTTNVGKGNNDGNGSEGEQNTGPGDGKSVSFETPDGRTVDGLLYGSGSCGVVFAPGVGYDKTDWTPQAEKIAAAGHTALTLDLDFEKCPQNVKTVLGAMTHLREKQNAKKIILVGASAGANAVVKVNATSDANIDGSVVLAPGKAAEHASNLSGRLLFIVGETDSEKFVQTTKTMHQRAPEPKKLVTLTTGEHAQGIFSTDQGTKLTNLIVEFVNTTCSSESE